MRYNLYIFRCAAIRAKNLFRVNGSRIAIISPERAIDRPGGLWEGKHQPTKSNGLQKFIPRPGDDAAMGSDAKYAAPSPCVCPIVGAALS